ncbi:MAG: hypothetical protein A2147_05905 [Chloroflexi bacterium RBG_16_57_8]|nr:MAG: hypothetical protein A2147_05905 [Chloroflexi bacterium RBG_16_57_8]
MTTTERAAQKLKENLVRRFLDGGIGFRVISNGLDPSHEELSLKVDKASPTDTVMESHGIKILLDPDSASALGDCELDYNDDSGGFFLSRRQ